jgi:transposase InsO family protein
MSRNGNCYDNAPRESFFHTLKTELSYFERFDTSKQADPKEFELSISMA